MPWRSRPISLAVALAAPIAVTALAGLGCSLGTSQSVEVGSHRVRLLTPAGWERLDHGSWQIFRRGEAQITLADLGPSVIDSLAPRADSAAAVLRRVLGASEDTTRREIHRSIHRVVGDSDWLEVETWDRTTHLGARKLAIQDHLGGLLVLREDGSAGAATSRAYETILDSLVLMPRPAPGL